jgi:hypothetical protein
MLDHNVKPLLQYVIVCMAPGLILLQGESKGKMRSKEGKKEIGMGFFLALFCFCCLFSFDSMAYFTYVPLLAQALPIDRSYT